MAGEDRARFADDAYRDATLGMDRLADADWDDPKTIAIAGATRQSWQRVLRYEDRDASRRDEARQSLDGLQLRAVTRHLHRTIDQIEDAGCGRVLTDEQIVHVATDRINRMSSRERWSTDAVGEVRAR